MFTWKSVWMSDLKEGLQNDIEVESALGQSSFLIAINSGKTRNSVVKINKCRYMYPYLH